MLVALPGMTEKSAGPLKPSASFFTPPFSLQCESEPVFQSVKSSEPSRHLVEAVEAADRVGELLHLAAHAEREDAFGLSGARKPTM